MVGVFVAVGLGVGAPRVHAARVVVQSVAELEAAIADKTPNTTIELRPRVYGLTNHVYLKRGMDLVGTPASRRHPATIRQSELAQFHAFDDRELTRERTRS